ncbi:MAG: alanine dehydrogenase [Negativicutes bacterium]
MIIGVVKEIKNNENRVSLTPAGAEAFRDAGHKVLVEAGAGLGSGFADEAYAGFGAEIISDKRQLFDASDMIMKVKEPLPPEYDLFHAGQILFTYLHLAPEPELTDALLKAKVTGIAYETIETANRSLPLLIPMSEIAGRMATQVGAHFLEKHEGGKGVLLGGVPGVAAARVVIVGGGIVGTNAARIAHGMGARVTIIDSSADRLRQLDDQFMGQVATVSSNRYNIAACVREADLVIGAVLIHGAKAPKLVTENMVREMEPGSVIVDVAIDQGGCVETSDHITTHSNPTFTKHGVIHYAVANMPGAVARTSTLALTNVTIQYALQIAGRGWKTMARENAGFAKGINVTDGHLTYQAVAEALNLPYSPLENLL